MNGVIMGYRYSALVCNNSKVRKHIYIHVLVCHTFVSKPENWKITDDIHHINGKKWDAYYKNLEFVTHQKNMMESCAKKIDMVDKKTNKVIKSFDSIIMASNYLKLHKNINQANKGITGCISGTRISSYGYRWRLTSQT